MYENMTTWPPPFFVAPVHALRAFPNKKNQQTSKFNQQSPQSTSLQKPVELDMISLPIHLFTCPSKNNIKQRLRTDEPNSLSDASAAKTVFP